MPSPPRPAAVGLFLLAAAAAAVVMDLSATHRGHHSDSLIPVLASLYKWEPYFWVSDRNGLLLPLLAAPVGHPFANLLLQVGLSVFAGVAALGLFARYLFPTASWPAVGAGAWGLVLFAYSEYVRFNMLNPCQPYAVAMFAAAVGLLLAERGGRWRWAAGGLFVIVGWVNVGLGMNLGPWLLARRLLGVATTPTTGRGLGLLTFGTAAGLGLKSLSEYHDTPLRLLPFDEWPAGWAGEYADLSKYFGTNVVVSLALLAVGVVWRIVPATREAAKPAVWGGVAAVLALLAAFLFAGTTEWVARNGYTARYLFPSLMLLNVAAAGAALGPPLAKFKGLTAAVVAAVVLPASALTVYGWPSVGAARAAVDDVTGGYTAEVLQLECTHLGGDYWDVWRAVFHANLTRADRGDPRIIWGVAIRGYPTRDRWATVPPEHVRFGWLIRPGEREPPGPTQPYWRQDYPDHRLATKAPQVWLYVAP